MSPTLWIIAGLVASLFLGAVSSWIYDLLKDKIFPNRPSIRAIVVIVVITASMIAFAAASEIVGQPPSTPNAPNETTQATLIAIAEKQLQIQGQIATAQSEIATAQAGRSDGSSATETALKLIELSSTQQALSIEATRIASSSNLVPTATNDKSPTISTLAYTPTPESNRLETKTPAETALPQVTARPLATSSRKVVRVYTDNSTGNYQVYAEYSDGTRANLTRSDSNDTRPKLSPDGRKVLFSSIRDTLGQQLYIVNIDGSGVRRITKISPYCDTGEWSPDSRYIAAVCGGQGTWFDIYLVNANNLTYTNLTNNPAESSIDNRDVAWLSDGRISFRSTRDGDYKTYVMNADGSNMALYEP